MNQDEINTFLKIIETGSILKASQELYISQSTCSSRIVALEEKLGYPLIIRNKGIRKIMLTDQGKRFLPIALSYNELYHNALEINNQSSKILNIISTDYLNIHTLKDIYLSMSEKYDLQLTVDTSHSHDIHMSIDRLLYDVGIVTNLYTYENIESVLLFEESFVMLKHKDCKDGKEIYIRYSTEYEQFHQKYFPSSYKMKVGTVSMAINYLNEKTFTIVPMSVAKKYTLLHPDYEYHELDNAPKRKIYAIYHRHLQESKKKYIEYLIELIKNIK